MRKRLAALAAIFLAAHLAYLSPTLEDIDSINFALGVRDFDVAQHRPHPPGSPVFIVLGKASAALFGAAGMEGAESRGLAFWSAVSGALMFPLVFLLFSALDGDRRRAFWTAVVAGLAPLAWFTASRPMSDFTGLALTTAAQALIVSAWTGRSVVVQPFRAAAGARFGALEAGALIAGLAAGVRVQTALLTAPALAAALVVAPQNRALSTRLRVIAAACAGVLLWLVPLLITSGGPTQYLSAFGTQATEHLTEVVLWRDPTSVRLAYHAVVNAFVWPWATLTLGALVVAFAAIGVIVFALEAPSRLLSLAILFGPYALFHLLLQETLTVRYTLPLVAPLAWLAVRGAEAMRLSPFAEIACAAAALVATVPMTTGFAKGSPGFAAMRDAVRRGGTISAHATMRRLWEWNEETGASGRYLRAPHGYEWLTLLEEWRRDPDAELQFLANPKRPDYRTLIDPQVRRFVSDYKWPFVEWPHLGGARPGAVQRIVFSPPGWILDRGWAVSAEVAGITEREGYGPHRRPSVAWVRGRDSSATLMIGGRHLGPSDEPARVALVREAVKIEEWDVKPGFFFRIIDLSAGALAGAGYIPLSVTAASVSPGAEVRVGLEQFDLQPEGIPMVGASEGWHEPEYNRITGRAWRWTSERAVLWVRPVGRDVTLRLDGESPLRYFDAPPNLRLSIGGAEVARLSPSADFEWEVRLPAAALASANGQVVLESDKWFVPGDREGTGDRRHLALRVYSVEAK